MTQANPIIGANKTGLNYRLEDNDGKKAIINNHKGGSEPEYAESGMLWLDDSQTPWDMKFYDGSNWISLFKIDTASNLIQSNTIDFGGADIVGNTGSLKFNTSGITRDFIFQVAGTEINRLQADNGWTSVKINGGSDLEFYEITSYLWAGVTIPAHSETMRSVSLAGCHTKVFTACKTYRSHSETMRSVSLAGCKNLGMTVQVNASVYHAGLIAYGNISTNGTVDLYFKNTSASPISVGLANYTISVHGA